MYKKIIAIKDQQAQLMARGKLASQKLLELSRTSAPFIQFFLREWTNKRNVYFVKSHMQKLAIDDPGKDPETKLNKSYKFDDLGKKLKEIGPIEEGQTEIIVCMMEYGDDLYYSNCIYLTRNEGKLRAFISDSSRGLTGHLNSNANQAQQVFDYGKTQRYSDVEIAMGCTLVQKDRYSCFAFATTTAQFCAENSQQINNMINASFAYSDKYKARNGEVMKDMVLIPASFMPEALMDMGQFPSVDAMMLFTLARVERMKDGSFSDANISPKTEISADELDKNLEGFVVPRGNPGKNLESTQEIMRIVDEIYKLKNANEKVEQKEFRKRKR